MSRAKPLGRDQNRRIASFARVSLIIVTRLVLILVHISSIPP